MSCGGCLGEEVGSGSQSPPGEGCNGAVALPYMWRVLQEEGGVRWKVEAVLEGKAAKEFTRHIIREVVSRFKVFMHFNCGCGFTTGDLIDAIEHALEEGHTVNGKVAISEG